MIIGERGYFDQFLLSTGLYVHLASRCPYPIIVYSLANNCRPTLVTLGGKVTTFQTQIFLFLKLYPEFSYLQNSKNLQCHSRQSSQKMQPYPAVNYH